MTAVLRRPAAFLIEAQTLFAPALVQIFDAAGMDVCRVARDADVRALQEEGPELVFVDVDYVAEDPLRLVDTLRLYAPDAVICVYTGPRSDQWRLAVELAGANAVLQKDAPYRDLVEALRDALPRAAKSGAFRKDTFRLQPS